jgi:menaquinone-specific isochorismate synthase
MSPFMVPEACDPSAAKELLGGLIEQAVESAVDVQGGARAVRVEIPLKTVNAIEWLSAQTSAVKTYWRDRDGEFEVAGVGEADVIAREAPRKFGPGYSKQELDEIFDTVHGRLSSGHANLRYFGGLRFGSSKPADAAWQRFGAYRFVLPRFEVLCAGGQGLLACNALVTGTGEDAAQLELIRHELNELLFNEPVSSRGFDCRIISREDMPERAQWCEMLSHAREDFCSARLDKVVLARETLFRLREAAEPLQVLDRLLEQRQRSFGFCFQLDDETAFLGATPELLYQRQSRYVQSEAVAGTRPRGISAESDTALGEELLRSEKDLREHRFVMDTIRAMYDKLCHAVHGDREVSLLKLNQCQHLFYRIEGILTDSVTDASMLATLNPTPAVGGFPTEAALRRIAEWEPFDRGWYAGPVGWIGNNAAQFAVGIRSGLIQGAMLRLYAGAGIVAGSDDEREWAELENKMDGFLNAMLASPETHAP